MTNSICLISNNDILQHFKKFYLHKINCNLDISLISLNSETIYNNKFIPNQGYIRISKTEIKFFIFNFLNFYIGKFIDNNNFIISLNFIHLKSYYLFFLPIKYNFNFLNNSNVNKIRAYTAVFYSINCCVSCKIYENKLKIQDLHFVDENIKECSLFNDFIYYLNCAIQKQVGDDLHFTPFSFIVKLINKSFS